MNNIITNISIFFAGLLVGMLLMVFIEFVLYKLVMALASYQSKLDNKKVSFGEELLRK